MTYDKFVSYGRKQEACASGLPEDWRGSSGCSAWLLLYDEKQEDELGEVRAPLQPQQKTPLHLQVWGPVRVTKCSQSPTVYEYTGSMCSLYREPPVAFP